MTSFNTIDVRNPGVVLLYVLRFVISALGYKYDISDNADQDLPFLIECFGLDIDKDLFQGLNLKDIIYNVMLHPDDAICALLELFYSWIPVAFLYQIPCVLILGVYMLLITSVFALADLIRGKKASA